MASSIKFDDLEAGDFQQTSIDGGLPRLIKLWESLRDLNSGGYGTGVLTRVKGWLQPAGNGKTDCSPFTATAIGMALDAGGSEPYTPTFDGGQTLDINFYKLHNGWSLPEYQLTNKKTKKVSWRPDFQKLLDKIPQLGNGGFGAINDSAGSCVAFNLGEKKPWTQMRRGDMLGLDWQNQDGHAAFCWNVHLNSAGEVDAFQIIASNSWGKGGGPGITVYGYTDADDYFMSHAGTKYSKKKAMFTPVIDDPQALDRYHAYPYVWYGVPGVKAKDVDLASFGCKKANFLEAGSSSYSVGKVRVVRLFGVTPPEPYLKSNGATAPKSAPAPAAPKPVAKAESKKADAPPPPAPPKVEAKEAQPFQADVELALQILFNAGWISTSPGDPKQVNDKESQAAIAEYQKAFMADVKVPQPGHADPQTRARINRAAGSALMMPMVNTALRVLFTQGLLSAKPGDEVLKLDAATRAAVKEFQSKHSLDADGIPGPMTQAALVKAMGAAVKQTPPPPAAADGVAPAAQPDAAAIKLLYWVPGFCKPGDTVALKMTATPPCEQQTFEATFFAGGKQVGRAVQLNITSGKASADVAIPGDLAEGSQVEARVEGNGLSAKTKSPLLVETAAKIATENGDDVFVDPPMRLWPQFDNRWAQRRVAGPDSIKTTWIDSGCGPSSAAMILRWFAEDCKAGRVAFPAKEGSAISAEMYGPRMAEAFWPDGFDYYRKGRFAKSPDRPGNPDGKVELNNSGVDFDQLFNKAAKWLGKEKAVRIDKPKSGDWLAEIRTLLKDGPVVLGLGAPAAHFVVAQGIKNGKLYIVDPGNVIYQASTGGKTHIADWSGKSALEAGAEKPAASSWPGGKYPDKGSEHSDGGYVAVSGTMLTALLAGLGHIHSLSSPGGPTFEGHTPAADAAVAQTSAPEPPPDKPVAQETHGDQSAAATAKVEVFFKYGGWIGPAYSKGEGYDKNKKYTYVGYRVPGKTSWFLRGRGNVDFDGAPNAYHPTLKNLVHAGEIPTYDVMRLDRPLESLADGPVGMQKKDGKLYVQTDSDPAPGYYVMATPLQRKGYDTWDPRKYADARVIPYFAIPTQVLAQKKSESSLPGFTGYEGVASGHTGNYGDYVTVVNLNPRAYKGESYPPDYLSFVEIGGKKYPIAHGVVGDSGNQPHIGECSYALGRLAHTLNGPEYADVLWMIHPGSGKGQFEIPEPADIQTKGQELFEAWGGRDQLEAVLALDELKGNGG